jgi:hypothetical protein
VKRRQLAAKGVRRQWRDPSNSKERELLPATAPVNKSKPKTYLNPFDLAGSVQITNKRNKIVVDDEPEDE